MPSIISTLTNAQAITAWDSPSHEGKTLMPPAVKKKSVIIKGISTLALNDNMKNANGAITHVTDDELEFLKGHKDFQFHERNGSFKILKKDRVHIETVEKIAKDMPKDNGEIKTASGEKADGSARLTDIDFEEGGRASGPKPGEQKII